MPVPIVAADVQAGVAGGDVRGQHTGLGVAERGSLRLSRNESLTLASHG
jgi:hypothetical protein